MLSLEKNVDRIKSLSAAAAKENLRFRQFLKQRDSTEVDRIVHRINAEVVNQIDCTECGNCCTILRTAVNEADIVKLSDLAGLPGDVFVQQHTEIDTLENTRMLKATPCIFLKNKKCTIYENRPDDCRSFPHTDDIEFTSRTLMMIENHGICPIVFNVLEQLKRELRFR